MHTSIATISSPEFINLQPLDINPLMSACEIKVLYLGANRNRSFISKEVATDMAKTLRGAPIVGYFKKDKGDFADHGEKVILDDEGIHFECQTTPYGFVDPTAKVWFQTFIDYDDFGNEIEREYLMTTGYLWTGQFEECQSVVEQGKPHSMELDEKTLNGTWSTNIKNDIEFFIINDATFSKLCILGDDVEPCFEGSSVTAPTVSKKFNLDDSFTKTLSSMMEDLKFALKGGRNMQDNQENVEITANVVITDFEESSESSESSADSSTETTESTGDVAEENPSEEPSENENQGDGEESSDDPAIDLEDKIEDDTISSKKKQFAKEDAEDKKDDEEEEKTEEEKDKDKEEENKKYTLLEENYKELETKYSVLQSEYEKLQNTCNELTKFKNTVDEAEKDAMIAKFYKLSAEDLKDIVANKAQYTVEEIESKLAVLYCRKGLSFEDKAETEEHEEQAVVTYNLDDTDFTPDWIKAVEQMHNSKNF